MVTSSLDTAPCRARPSRASRTLRTAAEVMLALAAATGCASVPVAPTPYPTLRAEPAYQCRPADGGDRVPCTAEEFEGARQRDALFEEAYDVFERYLLELDRLRRVGAGELSPEMESLITGSGRALGGHGSSDD